MPIQPCDVESILNNVLQQAGGKRVTNVHLVIGELVNMTDDAVQTSWDHATGGTLAEGATLHIHRIPAELQCMACFHKYRPDNREISCPRCGSVGARVITGEEFSVKTVDLDSD